MLPFRGRVSYDLGMWPARGTRVDPRPLLPYVLTLTALVGLAGATIVLAGAYHEEKETLAARHYARGVELRRGGRGVDAIPHFRMALSLARHHDPYTLALAETLINLNRPAEAETYLTEVLRRDPTSGIANLLRARIAQDLGRLDEAEMYYQRAVHGTWPGDRTPAISARFALAEMLLSGNAAARARAKSVASELRVTAGTDPESRRRVAALLLAADLPDQAVEELRALVDANKDDADAWAMLSAAELARKNYAATRAAARRAAALSPENTELAERLAFAERVLALDPSSPRLSTAERVRRGRQLLQQVVTQLDQCTGDPALLPEEVRDTREKATELIASRRRTDVDTLVAFAEDLWQTRRQTCTAFDADPAIAAVFERLSGTEDE
jgi:tetratricopeptide (TPR) repeat protein